MVSIRMNPIIMPALRPMKIASTTITMATDSRRLMTKPFTALVTDFDCMAISLSSIPTGIWS